MGSRRGPELGSGQNFNMKLLLSLCLLGLAAGGGQDHKMFMKWAKTKAQESCWGEDNMKLYTVSMKKAVSKCMQTDAPELDLPPFRAANRFVNNLVSMGGHREHETDQIESFMKFYKFSKMIEMMNEEKNEYSGSNYERYAARSNSPSYYKDSSNMEMEKLRMMLKMKDMMSMEGQKMNDYGMDYKSSDYGNFKKNDRISDLFKSIGGRFKRDADDSLALNDRLKEKLVGMMEEHVNMVSNMTCVLKELNVIDHNNNVDLAALKEDSKQYKMPSQWFGDKYEEILDGCYEVSENLPASLQEKYVPSNYNGPMRNLGKIKSFMNCCKSAKMKLCMNQDTKKKIEDNFGPVEKL